MIRSEILKEIAPILRDHLVVCNIGIPSQELHAIDDQPTNFYMLGTMGLASSIGLGLALAQPKPVIVIDGDGSILTNLGTTGKKTSLAGMARAAGCENVVEVQDVDTGKALTAALESGKMTVMVVKCDSGNAKMPVITMDPVVIKDRFMKAVAA